MSSENPGAWQLGHIDGIPRQARSSPAGDTTLEVVVAGADTSKVVIGLLDRVPTHGWRLGRDARVPRGRSTRQEVWVAPADSDTWWILTATHVDGVRHILIDPETRTPLPSREDRRSGLALDWVSDAVELTESETARHEFEFDLRNTSANDWGNLANDTGSITIVPSAEPRFYVDVGDDRPLPALPSGGLTTINARLNEPLSAGTYELGAVLVDLNLATSTTAGLTVTAD
ncbi:hypothetical protein [Williamsia sp.]|uniref:hypothetical protein n=1 Tax=Williamsia sp. TaxID=1872085 RepID=UPI002F940C33